MYKDFITYFKDRTPFKTKSAVVISDRPPIPFDLETNKEVDPDLYVYEEGQLTQILNGPVVDAALELRGNAGFLLTRLTYPEMIGLVAVPGMLVYMKEDYTDPDTQVEYKSGVYMSTIRNNLLIWVSFADTSDDKIILDPDSTIDSVLHFIGVNQRGQDVVGAKKPSIQSSVKDSLGVEKVQVKFYDIESDPYIYSGIENLSELTFADYVKLSLDSVDFSRVSHEFLSATASKVSIPSSSDNHEQITTVISGGNASSIFPTTTAATLELKPGDDPTIPFASFLTGRMDEATTTFMLDLFANDNLEGLSWYNTTKRRHQLVYRKNGFNESFSILPSEENNDGFSIGEHALISLESQRSIAIGFNASITGNTRDSIAIGANIKTTASNHAVLGNNAFLSINEKLNLSGEVKLPTGILTIAGNSWGNNLSIKPHIALDPLEVGAITLGFNTGFFYLASNKEFYLSFADSLGSLAQSTLNVKKIKVDDLNVLSNTSHRVSITAPQELTQDVNLILPETEGAFGQVLSTDGSGRLLWSTAAETITVQGAPDEIQVTKQDNNYTVKIHDNPVIPGSIGMTLPGGVLSEVMKKQSALTTIKPGTIRYIEEEN